MFKLLSIPARLAVIFTFCSLTACAIGKGAPTSLSHNVVHRTITPHTMQLVQVTTPVPYDEVTSRLYALLGPLNSADVLLGATSVADLQARVGAVLGSSGFMHFIEFDHGAWHQLFYSTPTPRFKIYVIGNPFIAETMVQYDLRAGYNVPPRLMILEDGNGTKIVHHLLSSVIDMSGPASLMTAAMVLDAKFEAVVNNITAAL
ncbi:unnamed protein product [Mycena citricolor]|uniref:DUF302 domain-containing protein n=2 Tax=Mycena citricolor TaxID=2018698 RepID=A0AAD2Q3Z3_9AGAR|nr:unnamed protein product [Mycena citricolor]CAK5273593.1 unnamed protein product [Mycena citricolor]